MRLVKIYFYMSNIEQFWNRNDIDIKNQPDNIFRKKLMFRVMKPSIPN